MQTANLLLSLLIVEKEAQIDGFPEDGCRGWEPQRRLQHFDSGTALNSRTSKWQARADVRCNQAQILTSIFTLWWTRRYAG